jgi:hypothetical protein
MDIDSDQSSSSGNGTVLERYRCEAQLNPVIVDLLDSRSNSISFQLGTLQCCDLLFPISLQDLSSSLPLARNVARVLCRKAIINCDFEPSMSFFDVISLARVMGYDNLVDRQPHLQFLAIARFAQESYYLEVELATSKKDLGKLVILPFDSRIKLSMKKAF